MKNIKLTTLFLLIFTVFAFTSCDNEPIDPLLIGENPGGGQNPGGENPGGGGVSTGDYWPTALNNQWVFKQDGVVQPPMKMISVNSINTFTYYTFDQLFGTSSSGVAAGITARIRKNSGDYFLKIEDFTFDTGLGITGTLTGYEMPILKDYLTVGQTWSGNFTQTATFTGIPATSQTTNYVGTLLARDVTEIIEGTTYTNVIKVRVLQTVSVMGETSTVDTEYWFSKNVGPIKAVTTNTDGTDVETVSTVLQSYILN